MPDTNQVGLQLSPSLLHDVLHLPDDIRIVGAEWRWGQNAVVLYLEGPDFIGTAPVETIPIICGALMEREEDGIRSYQWAWPAEVMKQ